MTHPHRHGRTLDPEWQYWACEYPERAPSPRTSQTCFCHYCVPCLLALRGAIESGLLPTMQCTMSDDSTSLVGDTREWLSSGAWQELVDKLQDT